MNLDEVVGEVAESYGCSVVLNALAEAIGQTGVAAVGHADAQVLPLNEARRNVLFIKRAHDSNRPRAGALRRAVAYFALTIIGILLNQHRVVDVRSEGMLNRVYIDA